MDAAAVRVRRMSPGPAFHLAGEAALVRLGLIGDNIARSRAPDLHRIAGQIAGIDVSYDRLIPRELGSDFDAVFERCRASGYRGINITYPYKELAARKVVASDELVREVGAVNTVVFGPGAPVGHNTDLTGFVAAYRGAFGTREPGRVALIGAGGVGKAVAFGLIALGAAAIRIVDRDPARAASLVAALAAARPGLELGVAGDAAAAAAGADGLINCTPVGMVGHAGTPVPAEVLAGGRWAFDAVYTPVETTFLGDARAAGLECLSGYELFFHQGIQAFRIFTGLDVPEQELRRRLLQHARESDQTS